MDGCVHSGHHNLPASLSPSYSTQVAAPALMTSALDAMRPTRTSAVFTAFATVALAASASSLQLQPGPGACEAILPPCSWSEYYVNTSAASRAAVHVRHLHCPSASQPESLHCCGFHSPSPCILRGLMPAAAWEDEDGDSSRRHLEFHDVTMVFDQDLTTPSLGMTQASHPSLSWLLEVSEGHSRGSFDAGGGICPTRSSAAPGMLELTLSCARTRAGRCELRRSALSTSAAAHVSPESLLGSLGGANSSFLGALYGSYSLWELASVLCAIAWLLVCLAA
ncbi:hypothetical protein LXA43DRAFT_89840 [Ganoderma leucocontextum]|nr:hypothetical protein LXA43DRAFT_89840 [Ganoderma leucocontextum]